MINQGVIFDNIPKMIGESLTVNPQIPQFLRNKFVDIVALSEIYAYEEEEYNNITFTDDSLYSDGEYIKSEDSSEKGFKPPFYHKFTSINAWDQYKRVALSPGGAAVVDVKAFKEKLLKTMQSIKDRLDGSLEIMCASAIQTGTAVYENHASIDYGMPASHKIAYNAAHNFAIDTVDPWVLFETMAKLAIVDGNLSIAGPIPVLLGSSVHLALANNPFIKSRADIRDFDFGQYNVATGNSWAGAIPLGLATFGSYKFALFGYNAVLKNRAGADVPLINPKGMTMMAGDMVAKMFYAGLPREYDKDLTLVAAKHAIYRQVDGFQEKVGLYTRPAPIIRRPETIVNAIVLP